METFIIHKRIKLFHHNGKVLAFVCFFFSILICDSGVARRFWGLCASEFSRTTDYNNVTIILYAICDKKYQAWSTY